MSCEKTKDLLSLYLYGELSFQQEEEVESHLDICPDCRAALEREKAFQAVLTSTQLAVPPELLVECRRDLKMQLEGTASRSPLKSWKRFVQWLDLHDARLRPVAAVALVALGFFSARLINTPVPGNDASQSAAVDLKATRVRNVEPDQNGAVRITLEETRQRTVRGSVDNDQIRGLLLTAARDPEDPGLRVESLDLLKGQRHTEDVKEALMQAVSSDPNPGVRKKAMEGLKPFSGDSDVRRTVTQVLLRDDNAFLRTQAIDLLIQHKQRDMISVLQELMRHEDNDYIRSQSRRVLTEMNASVESF